MWLMYNCTIRPNLFRIIILSKVDKEPTHTGDLLHFSLHTEHNIKMTCHE